MYLTENGLARSRERAKELIKNGFVLVDGKAAKKASDDVSDVNNVEVTGGQLIYVGKVHCAVLKEISAVFCENGFEIIGIIPSPIKGGDGNIEYMAYVKHSGLPVMPASETIKKIVENAFGSAKEI